MSDYGSPLSLYVIINPNICFKNELKQLFEETKNNKYAFYILNNCMFYLIYNFLES